MRDTPFEPATAYSGPAVPSNTADTIVAVSSPPGRSARGLIRVCGPQARSDVERLVDGWPTPRVVASAALRCPALPILIAWFEGPASYTGDDIVELQLPGHPALLDRVVHAIIDGGARLAEPGEFTFRAYTAGRLDLTQAEGIAATISAVSDGQLAAAAHLREGELARFAGSQVDRLGTLLALVEAGIDFVDQEDVVPIAPARLHQEVEGVVAALSDLLHRSRSWGAVEALPRVVLVGPPSVGKSTLFNALLGHPRAVIDAAPGTTRDALEEPLYLNGAGEVMLIDLAGVEDALSPLDEQVQAAARRVIDRADLVLSVNSGPSDHPGTLAVQTMIDRQPIDTAYQVHVSAVTGQGLEALRQAIIDRLGDRAVSIHAEAMALQPRHESALRCALASLNQTITDIDPSAGSLDEVELVALSMRQALDELAGLGGELTPDEVIGRVFSSFCVGK